MKKNDCIVCNKNEWIPIYNQLLLRCTQCGFVTYPINATSFEPEKLYSESYFQGEEYHDYFGDHEVVSHNFQKRIEGLQEIIGLKRKWDDLLEIGCATGVFGKQIGISFPKANYTGIDISKDAVAEGKKTSGLNLIAGDYLDIKPNKPYKYIFMWDVIEHLQYPHLYLEKIREESAEGSYLVITTGDVSSFVATARGKHWRMIHPPTHLHYFSKRSLSALLENYGFQPMDITYPSVTRTIKLIWYSLFILNKKPRRWKQFIYSKIPANWSISLNTRDIMMVVAKKV